MQFVEPGGGKLFKGRVRGEHLVKLALHDVFFATGAAEREMDLYPTSIDIAEPAIDEPWQKIPDVLVFNVSG